MIKKLSKKLSVSLSKSLDGNNEDVEIWTYGLELLLNGTIKFGLIAGLSAILGTFKPTFLILITFAAFRCFGGGVHFSTYPRCLTFGVIKFLILGSISNVKGNMFNYNLLFYVTLFLGILTIIKWVPGDTEIKPIKNKEDRKKQKVKTTIVLILWIIIVQILIRLNSFKYILPITLGALTSFIFITPLGYWFITSIDNILDKTKVKYGEVK
ncbi:accessory gene regulator B family protein [Anaerosalibacter bizertensis]|uniref:Accessory gene regulator B family protein n=1 Tax=Anaerosalibacter bizertensis TaxID=932217 RepID=A0A9Q4FKB5_9FIRM|nr:accessory gene regulator B family protein [Anaerosalibacter bizertensis]MBV1816766.1 accessory gene regulator B family protein [Bacteroidales bacterium MSK.15.36]MCB5560581.1 accessory gene regulator B family protein [Anaerosalibacter bizertensis]MCG4564396.1 accessory gene regulator B family protein [Anaerosalibacter bizertensis]MCG4582504.1 accessory gene regulator B family protein [Anaerosalibacter bizertensis]MCG4584273.1 accessory gene regulator B family protein [Anaerosalibacter bizer